MSWNPQYQSPPSGMRHATSDLGGYLVDGAPVTKSHSRWRYSMRRRIRRIPQRPQQHAREMYRDSDIIVKTKQPACAASATPAARDRGLAPGEPLEGTQKLWGQASKLAPVRGADPLEQAEPAAGETQQDDASIRTRALTHDQAPGHESVNESHRGVVPDLEALGELADAHPVTTREPLDGEQHLKLLWREARAPGRALGVAEKLTQRESESSMRLIDPLGCSRAASCGHALKLTLQAPRRHAAREVQRGVSRPAEAVRRLLALRLAFLVGRRQRRRPDVNRAR